MLNIAKNEHRSARLSSLPPTGQVTSDSYPSDLAALDALSPELRLVCFLVDVEGYPARDVAVLVGRSLTTVKLRLRQARRRLSQELENGEHT